MTQYKYSNVLWLCPPNFSGGLEALVRKYIKLSGLDNANIRLRSLSSGGLKKVAKTKYTWDQNKYPAFIKAIEKFNPDFIVCNDRASLGFLTQEYISLALTRGSVYKYKSIPILVIDDVKKTKSTDEGHWIFRQDMAKLKRWLLGAQRHQPKFAYTVCESYGQLQQLRDDADNALLIGTDIETSGKGKNIKITCSGYTCYMPDGNMHTYVIPFVDSTKSDGCFWRSELKEEYALDTMRYVHATSTPKTLQNGSYDAAHVITYQMPYNNYIYDSLHLWHSIYAEVPKRLDFITSLCQDFYRYWKDESKEDEKNDGQKTLVPQTTIGLQNYWRYNALDCYYTLMDTLFLLKFIKQPSFDWAWENYLREFSNQTGPALAGSLRGTRWNKKLQSHFHLENLQKSEVALRDLKIMIDDPEFNPSSPKQYSHLLYDVLGAETLPRQKKVTGEIVLKIIQTQHPLLRKVIRQVWAYKKPLNNASKYGTMPLINSRFLYKISAAGTDTGRYATKQSDFWVGSNVQNIPEPMRVMFEADPDYILFDFDYSQSDAYFTAFESEDPTYMETMLSDKDTHCIHAEHFFKIPYDKLAEGKSNHEDWCTHKITGVRSVTKKAVYGANYLMTGYTLLLQMGLEAVIAAGKHLGYKDAGSWNHSQLVLLCTKLIEAYFQLYTCLTPWLQEEIAKALGNNNLVKCYGGFTRLFFGDLRNDKAAQRKLAAFIGQGGTAGNINAFLTDFYYTNNHTELTDSKDIMFLFQVHDSVVGQVHKSKLHLLKALRKQMERDCTIHGRTFKVPVEGQVGIGWGKRMIDWHEDITLEEIETHERDWWTKFNSK